MSDPQQNQKIDRNTISDSEIQQTQARRDALSFQNSDQNNVTINNVMVRLFSPRSEPNLDWDRAKQILEQQLPEIRQRLRDGLIRRQQFEIGLEEQPQQVGRNPLEAVRSLEIEGRTAETLDPNRLIIEAFGREDIGGKLLILGAPGAGKTTMLLSLAEQLVVGALQNPQTTIPIMFELSTWKDDGQSIRDWLVEQLCENFGRGKRKVYGQWLDRGVLLPLLDGLDELGMERQRKCAERINEFGRHYGRLVVCCRVREYEEAGVRLDQLRGAVCLQALTDGQIERYLNQVRPGMWAAIQESEQMQQLLEPLPNGEVGLLRVPLFVSIAAIVYQQEQPFGGKADLLEKYIDRQLLPEPDRKRFTNRKWAYKNAKREPDWRETRHYLKWLATKLKQNNQTELLIEQLQPSWLDTPVQKRQYRLIVGLLMVLLFGLILGLIDALILGLILGLINALILGLNGGMDYIGSVEAFKISMSREARHEISEILSEILKFWCGGVIGVLIAGLGITLVFGLDGNRLTIGLSFLIGGLGAALICALIFGMKQKLKIRSRPNQGIHNSLQSMVFLTLFSYPFVVFLITSSSMIAAIAKGSPIATLMTIATESLSTSYISGGLVALSFVFPVGGGMAFVQHFCLRFVLACNRLAPWSYVSFLNYCAECRLLQRVGGRYRFLHKELLEHFAQEGEVGSQRL